MKKLILGIIAVFLIEIGFISYSQLSTSGDPTVAAVEINTVAPDGDPGILSEPNEDTPSTPETALRPGSGAEPQGIKMKAPKGAPRQGRAARRIRPRTVPDHALSARAVPHRPSERVAPRPAFHTLVQREYFGRMMVEVTYRVYNFRPRNSRTRRSALLA
jgi:hypothetical protein